MTAKEKMAIPAQTMPEQDPVIRARNMNEVALGYSAEQAKCEASRCLQCPTKPCMRGCPVAIDIPAFLKKAATGDFTGALEIIRKTSLLPAVCGRVCPQEKQCQRFCTMGKLLKDVDTVVVAVGNSSNPLIPATTEGLATNAHGNILVDSETNMTSIPGVFAGGDIVLGAATVILAMGEGRRAAAGINAYLTSGK